VLVTDLQALQQREDNDYLEIRVKPEIFDSVCTSVRRRAESCLEIHGNHAEHCCGDLMNITNNSAGIVSGHSEISFHI
jgi:hypothetical protein